MDYQRSTLHVRFWAIADQGIVSLGNFLTNLILARSLAPADFGVYALILNAILSANTFHAALVTYPVAVHGASMTGAKLRDWASSAIAVSLLLAVPVIGLVSIAPFATRRPDLAPYVGLAVLLWQLQETTRNVFFAHFRQRQAVLGDAISYWGQAGILMCLSYFHGLTVGRALLTISVTSGMALVLQGLQLKIPFPRLRTVREFLSASRSLGSWGVPSRLVTLVTAQAFPWTLFFSQGPAASAVFQAVGTAAAASNPVMISTSNLVIATVAASNHPKRFSLALGHAVSAWALVAPFFCFVAAFPALALRVLYGAHSPYLNHQNALRFMIVAYALEAVAVITGGIISGVSDTRSIFKTQAVAMMVALGIGVPLATQGVLLAVIGFVVSQTARVLYSLRVCSRLWSQTVIALEQVEAAACKCC